MLQSLKFYCLIIISIGIFMGTVYRSFGPQDIVNTGTPTLAARLGTVLWHPTQTITSQFSENVYCYYPKSDTQFEGQSGEYLIKKVTSYSDCEGWLGIVLMDESPLVTEKNKFLTEQS